MKERRKAPFTKHRVLKLNRVSSVQFSFVDLCALLHWWWFNCSSSSSSGNAESVAVHQFSTSRGSAQWQRHPGVGSLTAAGCHHRACRSSPTQVIRRRTVCRIGLPCVSKMSFSLFARYVCRILSSFANLRQKRRPTPDSLKQHIQTAWFTCRFYMFIHGTL